MNEKIAPAGNRMRARRITGISGFKAAMKFPARRGARMLFAAIFAAAACLAQESPGEHNVAAPDYLNPNFFTGCGGQQPNPAAQPPPAQESVPAMPPGKLPEEEPPGGKRVFGVLPNYRTASSCEEGTPINARRKLNIALKDSFDYPLVLLSAAYAGLNQLTDDDPSFGQGVKGYAHRLATNYADQAIGNMLTEGFLPVLFHQDPRYFRRGPAYSRWRRVFYAATRVIVTDSDSGHKQFNYSEWIGNASAAALSNLWEPDDRNASANAVKLFEYVGTDAVSQILKEFWPDIKHKLFHRGDAMENCSH
jgi:hypothetical protein